MKVLVELLVIVILLAAGWSQSYRVRLERLFGTDRGAGAGTMVAPQATPQYQTQTTPITAPEPTPKRENSWLWQPTKLDRKAR